MAKAIFTIGHMIGSRDTMASDGNRWFRAVPLPYYHGIIARLCAAWAVVTGNAYAVRWPEPGELEHALEAPDHG